MASFPIGEMMNNFSTQPPKSVPYPQYTQSEIDERLQSFIRYVMSIPESRLKPKTANNGEDTRNDQK